MTKAEHLKASGEVLIEVRGQVGMITLNRPKALNALSLQMVRDLTDALQAWRDDPKVRAIAIRGTNKVGRPDSPESLFGGFCAGGDIRFFHQAALTGDSRVDDFFTEEYRLNYLIAQYPKPYIAFMDGVVMGGGMGLCQGRALAAGDASGKVRIVTEHSKVAMPETNIGLFPDVGGGFFLSRCPASVGEYLGLTGAVIGAEEALAYGLADISRPAVSLPALWEDLASAADVNSWIATNLVATGAASMRVTGRFDAYFSLARVKHIVDALESAPDLEAKKLAAVLRKRSPLMLHVTLEQIRRARTMSLADELRMERDIVHHCLHLREGTASETVEGIRALVINKDYTPKWNPARIEDVKPAMVQAFFESPWTAQNHPLQAI